MSNPSTTPEERFAALVAVFRDSPDVTPPNGPWVKRGFGSSELKVNNKIFAMLSNGRLVVKLPRVRVDALVAAGEGERFDPRRDGRLMKEWLALAPTSPLDWETLARESLAFVASGGRKSAPDVAKDALTEAYREMAADSTREQEALEWIEAAPDDALE